MAEALGGNREAGGLFTFSGHGDRTGEGLVLCPTDTAADGDELLNTVALMQIRETIDQHNAAENLTAVLDCCHSGMDAGAHQQVLALRKRTTEQTQQKPEMPLFGNRIYYAAEVGRSAYQAMFCGRVHGAFTWAFMATRDQWSIEAYHGHKQLNISYGDMRQRTHALLESLSFGQAPELRILPSMHDLPLFCLGRQAEGGETSRKPTGERTRIQCDPGGKDYRVYTMNQQINREPEQIGQILVPRNTGTAQDGTVYSAGTEYWFMTNNVNTSAGNGNLQFSWEDYYWASQPDPPVSAPASFDMVQAPAWSSAATPAQSSTLFVDNSGDVPFCLNWGLTYDDTTNTWSGNVLWYDASGVSNVFSGDSSPVTVTPGSKPSSETWYSAECYPYMPINQGTGLSATRSSTANADMTFVWSVGTNSEKSTIEVTCNYGPGRSTSGYTSTATIPWMSAASVTMNKTQGDNSMTLAGSVHALWKDEQTFVVMFSGQMIRPNYNNIFNGTGEIIVAASIP